jgi:hypothetical protein
LNARSPIIWAISDGRAGIERQAQSLGHAIIDIAGGNLNVVRLTPNGPQTLLPPRLWLDPIGALPKQQQSIFNSQMPDIWIANGRRSIAYSLFIKKHFPNILTVQIQNPKVSPANFDFVVAPEHDRVLGNNVFETLGGLVYYSETEIKAAKAHLTECDAKKRLIVILGGDSKTHKFTLKRATELLEILRSSLNMETKLRITTSRRTPPEIANLFRTFAKKNGCSFFENEQKDGPNPYLTWLSDATHAIITEDSANMLADAAFFELPINMVKLDGGSRKFNRLHNSFVQSGAARWLEGEIKHWRYESPNNVKKIAKAIVSKWQTRQIS